MGDYPQISMGRAAFIKNSDILTGKLPLSLKKLVLNQSILPVMTYGAVTWGLTQRLENKLRSAQWSMERRMVGVTLKDRKTTPWIRKQTKVDNILVQIK